MNLMMKYILWIVVTFFVVACTSYMDNIGEVTSKKELRNKNLAIVIVTQADIERVIKETKDKK